MKLDGQSKIVSRALLGIAAFSMLVFASAAGYAADGQWSGTFSGASGHATSGSVTVTQSGNTITLQLGSNFDFDGAPDPYVGFGKDGSFVASTRFSVLTANSGAQSYSVPSSIDLSQVNEVYIWCHQYSVPLGVARLR
jgi:hypothetical protein